jgi:hypothetical protein
MTIDDVMRKKAYYALFLISLLITSCSSPCHQWKLAIIKADCPRATYVKAYLPAENAFNGIEAVLISCDDTIFLYFYALTLLFPAISGNEEQTEVSVSIGEDNYQYIAERLEGGQSLRLPEHAKDRMIEALLENICVEVSIGRYHTTLTSQNFINVYRTL